ncbi:MAG TPA: hypothetical protein VI072_19870 [Polyangiaceae bacterium]
MQDWKTRTWLLLGAGTGLLIGFSTRWYWGLVTAVILTLVLAASYLAGRPLEALAERVHMKRRRT